MSEDNTRREDMLRKLDALLAKADPENGATEAECLAAVTMAQKLMAKHNIEEAEVLMRRASAGDAADVAASKVTVTRHDFDTGTVEHTCYRHIFDIAHKMTGVRMIRSKYFCSRKCRVYFRAILVGTPEDIRVTISLFLPLKNLMRRMPPKRARQMGVRHDCEFENSYYAGVVKGVLEANEIVKAACAETSAEAAKCWQLVVVKKDAIVKQWIKDNIQTCSGRQGGGRMSNHLAHQAGFSDGKEMKLFRALK